MTAVTVARPAFVIVPIAAMAPVPIVIVLTSLSVSVTIPVAVVPAMIVTSAVAMVAVIGYSVLAAVVVVTVERSAGMHMVVVAVAVAIVAIAGRQTVCIHPASAFRVDIHAASHIVIDALLRHVVVIIIIRIPALLHHRGADINVYTHLRFTLKAGAKAQGQSGKQYDLFHVVFDLADASQAPCQIV